MLPFQALLGEARSLRTSGQLGEAAATYLRAVQAHPGAAAARALAELAQMHAEAGRPEEAKLRLAEALTHDADCALALWLYAQQQGADGDLQGFVKTLLSAIGRLELTKREQALDLAADLLLPKEKQAAFASLVEAALADGADSLLLAASLAVAARGGNEAALNRAFARLEPYYLALGGSARSPADESDLRRDRIGALLAELLLELGLRADAQQGVGPGTGRAIALMRKALSIDPSFGRGRLELGRVMLETEHFEEAVEILKPAPAQGAGQAGWAMLGRAFLKLGQLEHARVCAERAGPEAKREKDLWRLLH